MQYWFTDPVSEWFPALTGRISVSTVQGSEWLPDHEFTKRVEKYKLLQSCAENDYNCVFSWGQNSDLAFSYVYMTKRSARAEKLNSPMMNSLEISDHLQLVFDNPRVWIFKIVHNP
jgi:hypothetical protein